MEANSGAIEVLAGKVNIKTILSNGPILDQCESQWVGGMRVGAHTVGGSIQMVGLGLD